MLNNADNTELEHWIHYRIDDEPESSLAKVLTPVQVMSDAGIDPQTNYLEQIHPEVVSYKDKPDEKIELTEGMRFITKPTGPMPVS